MGNAAPTGDLEGDEFAEFDGIETLGYRVLGVQPNSPASKAGLVSFFDFILGANGEMLLGSGEGLEEGEEYDDVDFPALLRDNKGKVVELCTSIWMGAKLAVDVNADSRCVWNFSLSPPFAYSACSGLEH